MFEHVGFILVAGGSSRRFGSGNKLLQHLAGMTVVEHSVRRFRPLFPRKHFVVVVPENELDTFRALLGDEVPCVPGGDDRNASVGEGLKFLSGRDVSHVAIHDAARPGASVELLKQCLDAAVACGGAVPGRKVSDTIKQADSSLLVRQTPPRDTLYAVETPQVFALDKLLRARENAPADFLPTDDASFLERAGFPVKIVLHDGENRKITTAEDLEFWRWRLA